MVRRIHKTTELNIPECVWMIKSSVHNWKLFNTYTFQHGAESKQKTSVCGSQLVSLFPLLIVSTKIWAWHGNWKLLLKYCMNMYKTKEGFRTLFLRQNRVWRVIGVPQTKCVDELLGDTLLKIYRDGSQLDWEHC